MHRLSQIFARDRATSALAVLTLVVLAVMVAGLGDRFLSQNNLQSMATQVAEFGLLALAMGLAMLTGGIDLSVVSAAVLSAIVGAKVLHGDVIPLTGGNDATVIAAALAAMLLTGALCGLLNGLLVAKVSIPPILATLGTFILFSGIGMVVTDGQSVPVEVDDFAQIGVVTVADVPVVFLVMCLAYAVVGFLLGRTRTGRRIYLYGENNVALRFAGARNERLLLQTYVLIGLVVGVAAILMTSRVNSARVGYGESYLLQTILVVVLAGFNPYGGRGRVTGLVLGLVLLQSLQSAFTIMQFSPFMKTFIWGAMLLAVMVLNHVLVGRRGRRRARAGRGPDGGAPAAEGSHRPVGVAA